VKPSSTESSYARNGLISRGAEAPKAYGDRSIQPNGGDTTLIHGCVAKDGTTRVVSPTACKSAETPTHWPTAARIVTDETRITNTENKNTTQDSAISAIQTKNNQQDAAITTLQGQVGGGSGFVVKDSLGQVVGKVIDASQNAVLFRQIGNTPAAFQVSPTGLQADGFVSFVYPTSNCTGTRYMQSAVGRGVLFMDGLQSTDHQTWYFPTLPAQELTIQSQEDFGPGENPSGVGFCNSFTPVQDQVGTVSTISATSLGTPPFHLE
jgi:hypothetical protein